MYNQLLDMIIEDQKSHKKFNYAHTHCDVFDTQFEDENTVFIPQLDQLTPTRLLVDSLLFSKETSKKHKTSLLIDTGSDFGLTIPEALLEKLGNPQTSKSAMISLTADGSSIVPSTIPLYFKIGSIKLFTNALVIKNLPQAIIGLGVINQFFDLETSINKAFLIPRMPNLIKHTIEYKKKNNL
jgi:predicted aspartyl protease